MFLSSIPVTNQDFADRSREIGRLEDQVRRLVAGAPSWVAILGLRKIGKTSLLLELARRMQSADLVFAILDTFEVMPLSPEIFRRLALRVVDAVFASELGGSPESLAQDPAAYRAALQGSRRLDSLPPRERAWILEIPTHRLDDPFIRDCLELPERLAQALKLHVVVAWDEFQELAQLGSGAGRAARDPLPLCRSVWQRHRRVGYFVSGSARTMLRELVTASHSPFFQHFSLMELGPFEHDDAVRFLVEASGDARRIPAALAARAVDVFGGHPFYLQMLGETLEQQPPPLDEAALKEALQELLFSRSGRLALYFDTEFQRLVGRSTYLAAVLEALAEGPTRLSDVARAIASPTGTTIRYIERLGDAVVRTEDGAYRLEDATFGLWLRWRRPGGTVVPMRVVGDEAERAVAEHLARMGFELIYQSRASRGAFDLLALRGGGHVGVQVKRAALPVRFDAPSWSRMVGEGERLAWRWVVAAVSPSGEVALLDPARARRSRGWRLDESAVIENLLQWIDAGQRQQRAKPKRKK